MKLLKNYSIKLLFIENLFEKKSERTSMLNKYKKFGQFLSIFTFP